MTLGEQARYWGIGTAVFILLMWIFADILTPFVLGAAIAFLCDPLADRLEARKLSRTLATVIITFFGMGLTILAVLVVAPLIIRSDPRRGPRRAWRHRADPGICREAEGGGQLVRRHSPERRREDPRERRDMVGGTAPAGVEFRSCPDRLRDDPRHHPGRRLLPAARLGQDGGRDRSVAAAPAPAGHPPSGQGTRSRPGRLRARPAFGL